MERRKSQGVLVWLGLLTFSAGFSNAVTSLGAGMAVSHHTGNLTQLALAILAGDVSLVLLYLALLLAFFLGSILAGFFFFDRPVGRALEYGLFSFLQAAVILMAAWLLPPSRILILYVFMALGLGLQNGILKNVRGLTSRTSHMTGYLTDAGVALGARLRGQKGLTWQAGYLVLQLFIFLLGALAGGSLLVLSAPFALPGAGLIQGVCGLAYIILVRKPLVDPES